MPFPIVALGELLIDFTPAGLSAAGRPLFEQNPGGAPANVLCAAARQGVRGALISCVGDDVFGQSLLKVCAENGINTGAVQTTSHATTTLAFVTLSPEGDRSFVFARKPGADMLLRAEHIDLALLEGCGIFHFGSLSLCAEPSKSAALFAADTARQKGALISYDPNWRPALWQDEDAGIAAMAKGLSRADICKLSGEELALLTNTDSLPEATAKLSKDYPLLRLTVVTLGAEGCFYRLGAKTGALPTYDTKVVDTTGAGDAFWGVFLSELSRNPSLPEGDITLLEKALGRANAAGALCAAGRGAISSMPSREAIDALIRT